MTDSYTLRPGLLVSMQTSIKGNVSYHDLERDVDRDGVTEVTEIRTRKTVTDVDEQAAAIKQRTKIRGMILSVCTQSAFGLLCPNDREQDLRDAITLARKLTDEFNETARVSRMAVNVIFGRIAQDDVDAVRAISSELRDLMESMERGVKSLDVKVIRDAANKATEVGKMLSPDANERLATAITAARSSARKIAKAGDSAAIEIDRAAIAKIDSARTSFLDMDTDEMHIGAVSADARSIDMEM